MSIDVPMKNEAETHHGPVPPPDGFELAEPATDLLAGLKTGDWLDAQQFDPLRWIVPGIIPEGMTMLVGGPKIGKSWLSLGVALAVASGGRALGALDVGPPRPVLLLALEDGDRRLQERCRELIPGDPIPGLLHYMTTAHPGFVIPTIEAWLSRHRDQAPLVILDTLGKVMPPAQPGESAYQRDYRIAGRLKRIADDHPGCGVLVLHHDRKAQADDFVDGVSGTNGIAGAADTITVLCRPRTETNGLLKVTGRDVEEGEYAVTLNGGTWTLDGASLVDAERAATTSKLVGTLGDRSTEILKFAAGSPAGFAAADVAAALDIADSTARTYLGRLVDSGRLRRPARGVYTPVASVTSVAFGPSEHHTHNARNRGSVGGPPPRCADGYAEVQHPNYCDCDHFKEQAS